MLFIAMTKIAYFPYEYIDFGSSGIEWHKVARFGTTTILHTFAKKLFNVSETGFVGEP